MFELITRHGLALIFANVLLEQLGVPLPAVPTLIVAGALAVDGTLSAPAVFGVAFVASMIADSAWYVAGRRYGRRVMTTLCRISLSPDSCVRQTENHFDRWGGLTLVVGKFIPGLATIAPPLAGAMRIRWHSYLVLNGAGTALWAAAPIALGMLFHAQIERLVDRLQDLGAVALEAVCALLAVYVAFKWWERRRFYKMLRMARITAAELRHLMDSGKRPVIIDVRSRAERELDARSIPGAAAFEVEEIGKLIDSLPADRDVIFYCSCPNEASAARAAKRLIDRGYTRVRPLRGGLDAWTEAGYAIERRPGAPGSELGTP
jgi:membrane protein DedA with SNARE-associated domain/rhodanese-related sulfurtransferase